MRLQQSRSLIDDGDACLGRRPSAPPSSSSSLSRPTGGWAGPSRAGGVAALARRKGATLEWLAGRLLAGCCLLSRRVHRGLTSGASLIDCEGPVGVQITRKPRVLHGGGGGGQSWPWSRSNPINGFIHLLRSTSPVGRGAAPTATCPSAEVDCPPVGSSSEISKWGPPGASLRRPGSSTVG